MDDLAAHPTHAVEIHAFEGADGTPLAYRALGPAQGETIVLCHGLAAGGKQFIADARYFAALGYRVLVPDLRGHGLSSAPAPERSEGFAIKMMAADMIGMLDHAGAGQVHWVGNSLGGIAALEMIGSRPGRFRSLAMFGTAFALNLPSLVPPMIVWLYRLGTERVARITAANTTRHKPARPLIAEMIAEFDPKVGRAIAAHVRRYDLTENALGFAGPVLVLVGGRDHAVNQALRPALKRIGPRENWSVVEIAEGGHCANLDATDAVRAALMAFWAGV